MAKAKDTKIIKKLQKEVTTLKSKLKAQFQKGVEHAQKDIQKIRIAFNKHMEQMAKLFPKSLAKKTAQKPKTPKSLKKPIKKASKVNTKAK